MDIFLAVVLLVIGLILIIKGGDWFVDAAVWMAKRTGIPEIVIGATVVSIGTTLPELLVSTLGVINGLKFPDKVEAFNALAVNNAVGSMLCNMGLILGVVMLCINIKTEGRGYYGKAIMLLAVSLALSLFVAIDGVLEVWEGIVLLVSFVGFMALNFFDARYEMNLNKTLKLNIADTVVVESNEKTWFMISKFVLGAAAIAMGAQLLVKKGQFLAEAMGIPAQIIGITVLAIGTSLPELVTAVTSLKKGNAHLSMGNVIGANIINATLLLGLATVITGKGLPIDGFTKTVSLWFMVGISVITLVPSMFTKKTKKWQGVAMISAYLILMVLNIVYILK